MITSCRSVSNSINNLFLVVGESDQEQVYAQTQGTNFTQLFSTKYCFASLSESDELDHTLDYKVQIIGRPF